MEDVVLHYQSGAADQQLSSLLDRTQQLLEPFPCRPPQVFSPWFSSSTADQQLPIRPARPAPVITASGPSLASTSRSKPLPETPGRPAETSTDVLCLAETPVHLLPASPCLTLSPVQPRTESPLKRCWSVFTHRGVLQHGVHSLSTHFGHMVSVHKLHLRQRAKWVIGRHNCGAGRDLEQVWRSLSRSVRSSRLPTCNANIQRERAEIWVFCDVLYSEQVGRLLKEELQLSGRISLSVRRLGNVFSA